MKLKDGKVFSIASDNEPVLGCTISEEIHNGNENAVSIFSLAKGTSISAESYDYRKLLILCGGEAEIFTNNGQAHKIENGGAALLPENIPVGIKTKTGCVYTEIKFRKDTVMNEAIKDANVFSLKDLLPYREGKIVNMDIADNEKMKLALMSFDEGTSLSEHAAPGEALIFALDGQGIIGYEGKEYPIKAGENFKFAKGARHYVKADGKFKMALLLTLD